LTAIFKASDILLISFIVLAFSLCPLLLSPLLSTAYIWATMNAMKRTGDQEGRAMQAEVAREWVTYKQAGKISGLSRTTLRKLAGESSIKVRHVGKAVRINKQSLDRYMNAEAPAGTK